MEIFLSWSGPRSGAIAELLRDWLPNVINALKPWLSAADIQQGTRWSAEISSRLKTAKAGIICLTPSNLHSDWILFEAGALSKTIEHTYVCPLLIDLEPSQVKGPLAQFQATKAGKEGILKLLRTLNTAAVDDGLPSARLDEAFKVWWPILDTKLVAVPKDDAVVEPQRSDRDMLEEILAILRSQRGSDSTQQNALADARRNVVRLIRDHIHVMLDHALGPQDAVSEIEQKVVEDQLVYKVSSKDGKQFRFTLPRGLHQMANVAMELGMQLDMQLAQALN